MSGDGRLLVLSCVLGGGGELVLHRGGGEVHGDGNLLTLLISDVGGVLDVGEGVLNLKLLQLCWLGVLSWREGVHVLLLLVLGGDGVVLGGGGGGGARASIGSGSLADFIFPTIFFLDVAGVLDAWREGVHVLLLLVPGGDGVVLGGDGGCGARVSIGSVVLADVNFSTDFFSDVAGVLDVWREGVHVLLLLSSDGDDGPLGVAEGGGDGLPGLLSG